MYVHVMAGGVALPEVGEARVQVVVEVGMRASVGEESCSWAW